MTPCLFQLLERAIVLTGPSSTFITALVFSHCVLTLLLPSSTFKDPCDYIEPTQIIQYHLPSQDQLMNNFISICNLRSPL